MYTAPWDSLPAHKEDQRGWGTRYWYTAADQSPACPPWPAANWRARRWTSPPGEGPRPEAAARKRKRRRNTGNPIPRISCEKAPSSPAFHRQPPADRREYNTSAAAGSRVLQPPYPHGMRSIPLTAPPVNHPGGTTRYPHRTGRPPSCQGRISFRRLLANFSPP